MIGGSSVASAEVIAAAAAVAQVESEMLSIVQEAASQVALQQESSLLASESDSPSPFQPLDDEEASLIHSFVFELDVANRSTSFCF